MPIETRIAAAAHMPEPPPPPATLTVAAFSYDDRRLVLMALSEAMNLCGCWLLDRQPRSPTQMEFRFEVELRSVVELYAALIAAGLELTRASHLDLTSFCTLRKYGRHAVNLATVLTVSLEVTFLEELTLPSVMGTGSAFA